MNGKAMDKNSNRFRRKALNEWYRGRGIPNWRKDIKSLLENLKIKSTEELLNKSYALSLSDQYWIKEESQKELKWQDINFFTNDFKYKGFLNISLSSSKTDEQIDLSNYNFEKLNDLPQLFKEKLKQYQNFTDMSEERIEKIIAGLTYRINSLKRNEILKETKKN